MKVFKFGGASIQNFERMKETAEIIAGTEAKPLLIVVSALGKTTNALEKVAEAFFEERTDDALLLFERIKQQHLDFVKYNLPLHWQPAEAKLKEFFTEAEWLLHDKPVRSFDYYYDQIVCCGEMMSSSLLYFQLLELKLNAGWTDVRDIIRTDANFRDGIINWEVTEANTNNLLKPMLAEFDFVITQGFVGSTDENESTTLGREGSDFTAAIFANILQAEDVTIWKDVPGVMSGDPKSYDAAMVLPHISYSEVIEMAYYGAQVIHPKTIKPLQNKKIPLLVKNFTAITKPGTRIDATVSKDLPPLVILKENQVLISFKSHDFSFIEEKPINDLYEIFHGLKIKPNLTQNGAITLLCCFTNREEKISALAAEAAHIFDVTVLGGLSLLTIRHYDEATISKLTQGRKVLLSQKTDEVVQMILQ